MLVDKRKEVLRLYREILRTSRQFKWPNEQGQPWYGLYCSVCGCVRMDGSAALTCIRVEQQVGRAPEERTHGD